MCKEEIPLNLEYYRNFIAIVDNGTFSAAAQKLLIAQPVLSNQIKSLESEYGARLLDRGSRKLGLTTAGSVFYEYAKNICSLENSIKKELHSIAIGHSGILRLGLTHAAVDSYIESLLLMFHAEYPGIRFEITLNTSSKNIDMLLDNKLDIAFIRLSENLPTNLKHLFVVEEVLVAYFSRHTTWFNSVRDSIDIAELKDIPLSFTIGLKNKLNNLCKQSGFTPRCLCGAATRNQALFWTRHNLSVTLLFCNMEQIPQEKNLLSCKVTSLGAPITAQRSFVIYRGQELSTTASLFVDFVQNNNALV